MLQDELHSSDTGRKLQSSRGFPSPAQTAAEGRPILGRDLGNHKGTRRDLRIEVGSGEGLEGLAHCPEPGSDVFPDQQEPLHTVVVSQKRTGNSTFVSHALGPSLLKKAAVISVYKERSGTQGKQYEL